MQRSTALLIMLLNQLDKYLEVAEPHDESRYEHEQNK
jgi:hypothetical protein